MDFVSFFEPLVRLLSSEAARDYAKTYKEKMEMPKFMLLLHEQPADFTDFSPEDIQAVIEEYSAWTNKFAKGGAKLKDEGGKHLSMNGDEIRVTDGPYAEAKEVIGGILEIEAADYNAAAEICKTCPHLKYGGRIELREIDPV